MIKKIINDPYLTSYREMHFAENLLQVWDFPVNG